MLRSIFVLSLVVIGTYYALQGPFYALLFYLWYAYFRPEDWLWTDFIKSFNVSFIIGCYVLIATFFSRSKLIFNSKILLIIIFLVQTLLSTIFSEHINYSWSYWKDFLKSTVVTYLIVTLVNDFSKFRITLIVIVLSLGFEGAKQGWSYLLTSPGWPNPNQVAFLGDNNGVAVGMLMLVPIIALLARTTEKSWMRPLYWVLLLGVLYRALSTHSRGGFLACLAMGSVYWLQSRRKFRSLIAVAIVAVVVLATLPDTYWNRMQTIQTYEEEEETSALSRFHFWEVALAMAKANPVLGVGYNTYNLAYNKYDFSHGQYGEKRSVHNSFLAVAAELGYVGLALYLLIVFSLLLSSYRLRYYTGPEHSLPLVRESATALSASFVTFLVGGFFVIFQYQEMLWHFFGLSIVLSELARQSSSDTIPAPPLKTSPELMPSPTIVQPLTLPKS